MLSQTSTYRCGILTEDTRKFTIWSYGKTTSCAQSKLHTVKNVKFGFQDHNMTVIKTTGMTERVDKKEKIDKILRKHLPSFPNRMSKVT